MYRRWEADEARSALAPNDSLFKYRLVSANGKDAGRAAYQAEIRAGDVILNYRGQWLRVLALRITEDEDSLYDGTLEVEPA